jgi:hypothetical protein
MRLTIDEYSKHFKMSKEMINSKLRAKKLNYIIENNTTYIIVTQNSLNQETKEAIHKEKVAQEAKKAEIKKRVPQKQKTTVAMVLALYRKENQQLKEKIIQLEDKIDRLIDDKEQMLRDEMNKIEQVYSKKDEQLKNILELVNKQLLLQSTQTIHEVEAIVDNKTNSKEKASEDEIIELKEYLKSLDLESYQRKIIKKRFLAVYDRDIRIIKQNGKLYLNFSKYDYSDLLEY